jgi:predicted amidohydrolase
LAKKYSIAILFGVVIEDQKKAFNKSFFINSEGKILSQYSKIHPFTFAGEDKYYTPGNTLSIVNFNECEIGLTICYDLRFPELYSALAKESDIIINIANWPKKRVDHWNTLLKARAIENQIFIAGVNRTGVDGNGLEYEESSNIYNANGELLEYRQFEAIKIFQLSKDWTENFKKQFITVKDRKTLLYKEIL